MSNLYENVINVLLPVFDFSVPAGCGGICPGSKSRTRACLGDTPVDCVLSEWHRLMQLKKIQSIIRIHTNENVTRNVILPEV